MNSEGGDQQSMFQPDIQLILMYFRAVLSNMVARMCAWLLSTWNVASLNWDELYCQVHSGIKDTIQK